MLNRIFSDGSSEGHFLFVLITFLSQFPEGILLKDFVDFISMGIMDYSPTNWISPLLKLSLLSSENEDYFKEYSELDSQVANMLCMGLSNTTIVKNILEFKSELRNDVLSLKSVMVGDKPELTLLTHYLVREVVKESAEEAGATDLLYTGFRNTIIFHRLYLSSLLLETRQGSDAPQEDLIDGTQISPNIFTMALNQDLQEVQLFDLKANTKIALNALFGHYQSSYYVTLVNSPKVNAVSASEYYLMISKNAEVDSPDFFIGSDFAVWLEDCIMKIMTLSKVLGYRNLGINIQEIADKLRETANNAGSPVFLWLPYKTDYWVADKLYHQLTDKHSGYVNTHEVTTELESTLDNMGLKLANMKTSPETALE